MSALLVCKNYEIGDFEFKVRPISVAKARKVLAVLQKCVGSLELNKGAMDNFLLTAGIGGALTDEDLGVLIDAFGEKTTVSIPSADPGKEPRQVVLSTPAAQDEVFSGQFEHLYEWLDKCVEFNFAGTLAKMHAVVSATMARVEEAAKAKVA